jgi:ankyrin repeat protein
MLRREFRPDEEVAIEEICRALLASGADTSRMTAQGWPALHFAVHDGREKIVLKNSKKGVPFNFHF